MKTFISKSFILFVLAISISSCSTQMSVTKLENGEYFENFTIFKKHKVEWIEFYLEKKLGYQGVNLEFSQNGITPDTSEAFTITDINGNNVLIEKDKLGFDICFMIITYIKDGKINEQKTMILSEPTKGVSHIATKINGKDIQIKKSLKV